MVRVSRGSIGTLGTLLLAFVSAVVLLPLGGLIGRVRKRSRGPRPGSRLGLWMGWVGSALNLVFLFVMLLSFGQDLIYGVPLSIRAMLLMPIVTGVLGVVSLILAVTAWIRGTWPLVGWPYYSLIALASVVFALFAGYWNMVGWRF